MFVNMYIFYFNILFMDIMHLYNIVIVFDTFQDGYWIFNDITAKNVKTALKNEIPITFTRSFFARNVIAFEQWLSSLGAWSIALLFIGLFMTLFAIMIAIDYCCNSPENPRPKVCLLFHILFLYHIR